MIPSWYISFYMVVLWLNPCPLSGGRWVVLIPRDELVLFIIRSKHHLTNELYLWLVLAINKHSFTHVNYTLLISSFIPLARRHAHYGLSFFRRHKSRNTLTRSYSFVYMFFSWRERANLCIVCYAKLCMFAQNNS